MKKQPKINPWDNIVYGEESHPPQILAPIPDRVAKGILFIKEVLGEDFDLRLAKKSYFEIEYNLVAHSSNLHPLVFMGLCDDYNMSTYRAMADGTQGIDCVAGLWWLTEHGFNISEPGEYDEFDEEWVIQMCSEKARVEANRNIEEEEKGSATEISSESRQDIPTTLFDDTGTLPF